MAQEVMTSAARFYGITFSQFAVVQFSKTTHHGAWLAYLI